MFDETSLGSYLDYIESQISALPNTKMAADCAVVVMSESDCFTFPIFITDQPPKKCNLYWHLTIENDATINISLRDQVNNKTIITKVVHVR